MAAAAEATATTTTNASIDAIVNLIPADASALAPGRCVEEFIAAQRALIDYRLDPSSGDFETRSSRLMNAIAQWAAAAAGDVNETRHVISVLHRHSVAMVRLAQLLIRQSDMQDAYRQYSTLIGERSDEMARITVRRDDIMRRPPLMSIAEAMWYSYGAALTNYIAHVVEHADAAALQADSKQLLSLVDELSLVADGFPTRATRTAPRRAIVVVEPRHPTKSPAFDIQLALRDLPVYSIDVSARHVHADDSNRIRDLIVNEVPAAQHPVMLITLGEHAWLAAGRYLGTRNPLLQTDDNVPVRGVITVMPRDGTRPGSQHRSVWRTLLTLPSVLESKWAHATHINYGALHHSNPYLVIDSEREFADEVCRMAEGTEVECSASVAKTLDEEIERIRTFYDRVGDKTPTDF